MISGSKGNEKTFPFLARVIRFLYRNSAFNVFNYIKYINPVAAHIKEYNKINTWYCNSLYDYAYTLAHEHLRVLRHVETIIGLILKK